jgi:mono/diheme cytochrome c family protein
MNRYTTLTFLALLILILILPIYAWLEPARMVQAQTDLRQEFVSDAAVMYVENCTLCHGAAGEGIGPMPPLDNPGLREADYDFLYKTIARGRYDTSMTGWHEDEGGVFNDYQVDELVALVRYVDWPQVGELSAAGGLIPPTLPVPETDEAFLTKVAALSPEGSTWAEGMAIYAANCAVCHSTNGEGSDLAVALNTPEIRATDAAELAHTIKEGVPSTMMAGWDSVLETAEVASVVAFLQNWDAIEGEGLVLTPPNPTRIDLDNPLEVLALGERLYNSTCIVCHGENGSGGSGPVLNSQQVLSNKSDEQIRDTVINGGRRPNSSMPAFGDRLTAVEIDALVSFVRAWEPTAPWVQNPRGTDQGGGPPWLRATPDPDNPIAPSNQGQGRRRGGQGGGPPWRKEKSATGNDQQAFPQTQEPALFFSSKVVTAEGNVLTFLAADRSLTEAMLDPPWFWSESGILLRQGDIIELEGFESPDHMELNWISNVITGESIQLRTLEGVPVWNQ